MNSTQINLKNNRTNKLLKNKEILGEIIMKLNFKTKARTLATAAVLGLAMMGSASALTIDFTEAGWLGSSTSATIDGVTVSTGTADILVADGIDDSLSPCGLVFPNLACDNDGIGIAAAGSNDDEVTVNTDEVLTVTFDAARTITGFGFLDFFDETGGAEKVEWAFNGASFANSLIADGSGGINGFQSVIFEELGVLSISFRSALPANSDFALASINFETSGGTGVVPVPAALPLFGTGLAVMGFIGWRRKRKATA